VPGGASVALQVDDVTLSYGGLIALSKVELAVHYGHVDALIGPNGAGKTSLFDVVTGLTRPSTGRVSLDGVDVTRRGASARARLGIARTFQRLELFSSLTVRENVQVAAEAAQPFGRAGARRARAVTAQQLERTGLAAWAGARVDTLSTGTGRLVELARALASEPKVLLLDEPASGLDRSETAALADLLAALASDGLGVLLVEHDFELVMAAATTLTVLDRGKVVATGDPEKVRSTPAVQAAYLGPGVAQDRHDEVVS
jgi:branched-chain amino acid transport system ATP-binding protein